MASEPIGMYDAALNLEWWPNGILERVLIAYAERYGLSCVRAFASATGAYPKVLRRIRWSEAGIRDNMVLTPWREPGGMHRSPASVGQALVALRNNALRSDWQSSYGLGLDVYVDH